MKPSTNTEIPARNRASVFWSCMTVVTLLSVVAITCVFLMIFINPTGALNPFPPPTLPAPAALPTETPTDVLIELPPTWTPTLAPTVPPTATLQPTETLPPTPTPLTLTPTAPNTLPPPADGYPYEVRTGSPKAIPNIYHPELACNWMGVGGQVVDMNDAPVTGLIIRLGGGAQGIEVQRNSYTLTGVALSYGRAGYEFKLADAPAASRGKLWVQIMNQAGVPLSDQVYFDTYGACEQNLIIIDFKQVR